MLSPEQSGLVEKVLDTYHADHFQNENQSAIFMPGYSASAQAEPLSDVSCFLIYNRLQHR